VEGEIKTEGEHEHRQMGIIIVLDTAVLGSATRRREHRRASDVILGKEITVTRGAVYLPPVGTQPNLHVI